MYNILMRVRRDAYYLLGVLFLIDEDNTMRRTTHEMCLVLHHVNRSGRPCVVVVRIALFTTSLRRGCWLYRVNTRPPFT